MSARVSGNSWQLGRPYLLRHILLPGLAGVLAGNACVAALLGLDTGGLRTLMAASDQIWVAAPLLCVGFATKFGSAAIAASVMAIGEE